MSICDEQYKSQVVGMGKMKTHLESGDSCPKKLQKPSMRRTMKTLTLNIWQRECRSKGFSILNLQWTLFPLYLRWGLTYFKNPELLESFWIKILFSLFYHISNLLQSVFCGLRHKDNREGNIGTLLKGAQGQNVTFIQGLSQCVFWPRKMSSRLLGQAQTKAKQSIKYKLVEVICSSW